MLVLAALSAFGPFCIDTYLPALPQLARDLDTSAAAVQLTLGACFAGLAAGQLAAGPLSDARGRRPVLFGGLALFAVASFACALAPTIEWLIALRFVQGCAGAAGLVVGRAIARDRTRGPELARLLSLLLLINGAAPVLAPLLGAQLLRVVPWTGAFVALGLLGLALLAGSVLVVPETLPPQRRERGGMRGHAAVLRRAAGDRRCVGFALASGLATGAMFAYIAGSPFVLQEVYGVSPQAFSALFALNAIGIAGAGALNRRLLSAHAPRVLLLRGALVQLAAAATLLASVTVLELGLAGVLVPLFVVVACIGVVQPNGVALALEPYGEGAGSAAAIVGVLQYAFGAVVAPLAGVAGSGTAVPMALLMLALCAAGLGALRLAWSSPLVVDDADADV